MFRTISAFVSLFLLFGCLEPRSRGSASGVSDANGVSWGRGLPDDAGAGDVDAGREDVGGAVTDPCSEGVENDEVDQAMGLLEPGAVLGETCPGDVDWYRIEAAGSTLVDLAITDGPVVLQVYRTQEAQLLYASVAADPVNVVFADVLWIAVVGSAEGSYEFTWSPRQPPADTMRVEGVLRYRDYPIGRRGFGPGVWKPMPPTLVVELLGGDAVLARTKTTANGRYRMEAVLSDTTADVRLQVLARMEIAGWSAEVQARRGPMHVVQSEESQSPAPVISWDLDVPDTGSVAGAFNILDVVLQGHDLRGRILDRPPSRDLLVRWQPGSAFSCGSCYFDAVLQIGGGDVDPDHYDDSVIAHEFGHFVSAIDGREDGGGGAHDGSPTDPALAWQEGSATFWGQWSLGDSFYFDSYGFGDSSWDLEEADANHTRGTVGGAQDGDVSELLVAAALWDLADDGEEEVFDRIVAGDESLAPHFHYLPNARDRGASGIDLVDYLDGFVCADPERLGPVTELLDAFHFPYDGAPRACDLKMGAPIQIERLAPRRFWVTPTVDAIGMAWLGAENQSLKLRPVRAGEGQLLELPSGIGDDALGGVTVWTGGSAHWHRPLVAGKVEPLSPELSVERNKIWRVPSRPHPVGGPKPSSAP